MRRVLLALTAVAAVAAVVLVLRTLTTTSRDGGTRRAGSARFPGEPGGGVVADPVSSPLDLRAELLTQTEAGIRVGIETKALEEFTRVQIVASRYDSPEPRIAWAETLWVGALRAGASQRLEATIPFGAEAPRRVVVTAQGSGTGGARYSTTDVVHLEQRTPGGTTTAVPAPAAAFDSLRPVEDR